MSVPTQGETYVKLLEHLIKAQEECAMMSHLVKAQGSRKDDLLATGWLGVQELLKRMQVQITKMAQGKLQ